MPAPQAFSARGTMNYTATGRRLFTIPGRNLDKNPLRVVRRTRVKQRHEGDWKPFVEQLEDRLLLATITCNALAGGSWNTGSNWDLNRTPTTGDNVIIPNLAGSQTIAFSSGTT